MLLGMKESILFKRGIIINNHVMMKKNRPILLRILGLAHIVIAIVHLPNILFFSFFSAVIFLPALLWIVILGVWL